STAKFEDVHVRQRHDNGQVQVNVEVRVENWGSESLWVRATLIAPDGSEQESETTVSAETVASIGVDDPQYWWPNGYGEQNLYQFKVALESKTSILDPRNYQIGLRTIELKQEPDEWGESFTFYVNTVPVFVKGADWIPADSFPTRITDEHLETLI